MAAHGPEGRTVRLYDATRRRCQPISTIDIDGFHSNKPNDAVEHIKFDPYGQYLALGRSDNFVQVLDVNNTSEMLRSLYHAPSIAGPGADTYGITKLRWITGFGGKGLRLFSGGDDGMWRNLNYDATDARSKGA